MRRCVHMVEKASPYALPRPFFKPSGLKGLRACGRWLRKPTETVRLDGLTWDLYRCRGGHVTRLLVKS